jgi:hypothetical protein
VKSQRDKQIFSAEFLIHFIVLYRYIDTFLCFHMSLRDILCLPIAYPACSDERLANRTANGGLKRNEDKVSNDLLHSFVVYFIRRNNADNSNTCCVQTDGAIYLLMRRG